jgi:toxin ParE1/3/4
MRLRYDRGALADLDQLFAYTAENRHAASQIVARIQEVIARITASPYMGKPTHKPGFRQFRVGHYLIVYEVTASEVIIFYIRHDARRRPWEGE